MSRGPGRLQFFILEALEAHRQPILVNLLMWDFNTKFKTKEAAGEREIRKTVYTSFLRAVNGLVRSNEVERQSRRLRTLDEVVEYYPYKTRSVELKELRLRLLPRLRGLNWSALYGASENEDFIVGKHPQGESIRDRWERLRFQLLVAVRTITDPQVAHIHAHLIVRGDALFSDRAKGLVHPGSFVDLASCLAVHLEESLAQALTKFFNEIWPPTQRKEVALKSQLYAWVNFSGSTPSLKPEARDALRKLEPQIMADLVIIPRPTRGSFRGFFLEKDIRHEPILDQLLQRDVLGPFDFLGLPGAFEHQETGGRAAHPSGVSAPSYRDTVNVAARLESLTKE